MSPARERRVPPAVRRDALLVALAWAAFLPMLWRGFASEDFVILRRLLDGGLVESVVAQFTGPWLRLAGIGFYRPVSTGLLGLEIALFGTVAWPYLLVHSGVHALNAVLVARSTRLLLGRPQGPAGTFAGLLFALHPLALNAVGFIASFATVFGVAFALAALLAWWRWRVGGGSGRLALALGLFVLALGSYELAAAVPGLVIVADLAAPGLPRASWSRRLRDWSIWLAVLAAYLAWRRVLFGAVLGGYAETADLITRLDPARRIPEAARALAYLFVPAEAAVVPVAAGMLLAALAVLGPPLLALLRRASDRGEQWRTAGFGLLWALVGLAPFGVVRLVPANGRYAYLAMVGCAVALARAADGLEAGLGRAAGVAFRGLLLAGLTWLFVDLAGSQLQAGTLVAAAQRDLAVAGRSGSSPLLCLDYPLFVTDARGTPVAQVFHYGLSDAARPPFGPVVAEVLPLTPGVVRAVDPLLRALPSAQLLGWRAAEERFAAVERESLPAAVPELAVVGPASGVSWPLTPREAVWAVEAPPGARCEIVVAAAGNASRHAATASGTTCSGELPRAFLDTEARLYGGAAYWWVELTSDAGGLLAASTARRVDLGTQLARGWS